MLRANWACVCFALLAPHALANPEPQVEVEACALARKRGVSPEKLITCGKKWAVMNIAVVPEFWEVHEVIFYWDTRCTLAVPFFETFQSSVMANRLANTALKAVDGDLSSRWTANCRYLLGGCHPRQEYVGIDNTGYLPVNLNPEISPYANVRCLKIYQSPNQTRRAASVAVITWVNDTAQGYEIVATYNELTGGAWVKRPAEEHGLWRLWNRDPTPRPWEVAEFMFYSDTFCKKQTHGVVISSGSFWPAGCVMARTCDAWEANNAVDGVLVEGEEFPRPLPTKWIASCPTFGGCQADSQWIGLDLGQSPVTIRCIRIFQPTHEGYPLFGHPTYSSKLMLQGWDGYRWNNVDEFKGLVHGAWNDTVPPARSAWAITNYDSMQGSWEVYELGFYEDVNCGGPQADNQQVTGSSIHSNPELTFAEQTEACRSNKGSCADLAFDSNPLTAWEAACSPCKQFDAWIGLLLRNGGREIRCYRFLQSSELAHLTSAVQLNYWDGKRWTLKRREVGIGGGTWNYRPSSPKTMWRIFNDADTVLPWTVKGFQLYTDRNCNNVLEATALSCGHKPSSPLSDAFDDNDESSWEASCKPPASGEAGCGTGQAWIGVQSHLEIKVKCFRLMQHETRERSAHRARVQDWDGVGWAMSSEFPTFEELGSGSWQMLPGLRGSMWRLATKPVDGMHGFAVAELQFFRSSDCSDGAVQAAIPNHMPICSAYSTSRKVADVTGYTGHLLEIGDDASTTPDLAFDNNLGTFWADLTTSQSWIGMDVTTQVMDIRCIKLAMAGVRSLQASHSEVQAWDGAQWVTSAQAVASYSSKGVLSFPVPATGGVGFQRRPLPSRSMWRLQNEHDLSGWEVMEVEFYKYPDCTGDIVRGSAIGSIPRFDSIEPDETHHAPARAFDDDVATRWAADCSGKCGPGQAWIGVDAGEAVTISCIRLFQTGRRDWKARSVAVAYWEGSEWKISQSYGGLGGDTWNMRPAAPDSMWRLTYMKPADLCPDHGRGLFTRSWGISELELYADDECSEMLPGPQAGAIVIASGVRQTSGGRRAARSSFSPDNAFDGDTATFWAAQCGNMPGSDEAKCAAGLEWIGLDFNRVDSGAARDVRCIRIHQNRASQRECCDPAEEVLLERWNGTDWTVTVWRHQPQAQPLIKIDGTFSRLGICASGTGQIVSRGKVDLFEERRRRQSDQCVIPLAASVRLLSDPLCDKHSHCMGAGFTGECCPSNSPLGLSRCCCDFLMKGKVFEDEYEKDVERNLLGRHPILGLEYAVIRSVVVLPGLGLIVAIIMYILANIPKPSQHNRCLWRPYMAICAPFQSWLGSESYLAGGVAFWVLRKKTDRAISGRLKGVAWLAVGFVGGGGVFWLMISYIVAEFFIKITVLLSLVINVARSPYKPADAADEQRMRIMLGGAVSKMQNWINFGSLGDVAAKLAVSSVMFVVYLGRGIFDFVLMRFSLLAIGLVDDTVSVTEILYYFPDLPIDLKPMLDLIYQGVGLSGVSFQETFRWIFEGVPRCEGPVVLFSGMWLIAVTLVLVRWLNYDFFGIFTATKQVVTLTRPIFQKSIGLGFVLGFQGGLFLFMQCIMLLFTRALKLVNPLEEANQNWTCPYDYDLMSIIVGRTFLIIAAAVALVITFLCANGHFMGQDYIVGEFARWIGMDLTKLDPDGVGYQGGMIRFDTFLAMIPTTFGIWIDGWNVRGFLIKERADVYASQLDLPFFCPVCGESHVPYTEVMRATGMQLSLAYQLMPAGALIGKACEYFNNPPLLYCGSSLKCYHENKHIRFTLDGIPKKLNSSQSVVVWGNLLIAFCKDQFFPLLVRISCLGIYVVLTLYAVSIDRHNIKTKARQGFELLLILCGSKASLEYLAPAMSLVVWGFLVKFLPGEKKNQGNGSAGNFARKLPVIGQVVNGVLTGNAVTFYCLVEDPWSIGTKLSILFGVVVGLALGMVAMLVGVLLEQLPGSRLFGSALLFSYQLAIAPCAAWLMSTTWITSVRFVLGTCAFFLLISVSSIAFRPPAVDKRGRNIGPSMLLPLLTTARSICGPVGIIGGVFSAGATHKGCTNWLDKYAGLGVCMAFGLLVGVLLGFCADSIIEQPAAKTAIPAGALVAFVVALLWHWVPGIASGAAVACCLGAIIEYYVQKGVQDITVLVTESPSKLPELDDEDKSSSTEYPSLWTTTPRSDLKALTDVPNDVKALTNGATSPVRSTVSQSQRSKSESGFATTFREDASQSNSQAWQTQTTQGWQSMGQTMGQTQGWQTQSQTREWVRPGRSGKKYNTLHDRILNHTPWATSHGWTSPTGHSNERSPTASARPSENFEDAQSRAMFQSTFGSVAQGVAISPESQRWRGSPSRSVQSNSAIADDHHRDISPDSPATSPEAFPRQASVVRVVSNQR